MIFITKSRIGRSTLGVAAAMAAVAAVLALSNLPAPAAVLAIASFVIAGLGAAFAVDQNLGWAMTAGAAVGIPLLALLWVGMSALGGVALQIAGVGLLLLSIVAAVAAIRRDGSATARRSLRGRV